MTGVGFDDFPPVDVPPYYDDDTPPDQARPDSPQSPDDGPPPLSLHNMVRGGAFILDTDVEPIPVWGRGRDVLWAEGEALVLVGGQGAGKTTLAQQLALARCGFQEYATTLDLPVRDSGGRVLYLAMDRPRQAARSFRRMVGEAWRHQLDERLAVWQGPPVADMARHPTTLASYARHAEADTVVVDSIKDAAIGLSEDPVGSGWHKARGIALRDGVELIELHHNRKALSGAKASTPSLDDVYGSTWITAGAGSVVLLAGAPGDPIVSMHHLKQPSEVVGPLKIIHDHDVGRSSIWHAADLVKAARVAANGLDPKAAARLLNDVDEPTPAQREQARRRLESLVKSGHLTVIDEGDQAAGMPRRWGPC